MKKQNLTSPFVVLAMAGLSSLSALAAGTDTWVGNTDANWSTAANWDTAVTPANGDSLVFGAAGSSGTSLNNDLSGLTLNKLTFSGGASSFTFGGNGFTISGGIDASALTSGTETISGTVTLANGLQIWTNGTGATITFGSLGAGNDAADLYGPSGAIAIISKTGTFNTTTADGWGWRSGAVAGTGLLGPGLVIDNGDNTYDWGSVGSQTAGTSRAIVAPTYTSAANSDAHNVKVTANTTVTPNSSWASLLVQGATLTQNGANLYLDTGIILENGGVINGSGPIKANADGLYIYTPDTGTIGASLQNNGSTAKLLYKAGPGTLNLTGNNSYTGGTVVDQGTLSVGNASALGSGALTMNGGNLDSSSANLTLNNNIAQNWNADFTFAGSQSLNLGTGAVTLNATRQVTILTNTLTVGGVSGSGYGLIKAGGGTLKLNGANSYTGTTTVNGGVLLVANTTQGNGPVTVADGAAAGVTATADATYWSPSSLTVGSSTGGTLQFGVFGTTQPAIAPASLTLNGTTTINISSAPFVNGASYPLFSGYTSGTLVLGSQPNGLLGQLVVSAGTVSYAVTNVTSDVWTAAVNTNWDTTTANWTNSIGGNLFAANNPVRFDDSAAGAGPLLVNITPSTVAPSGIIVSNTAKSYVIGGLAIYGSTGLTKNGTNTLTLTGTNTFIGDINISAGTVTVDGAGQLGGGTYAGNIDNAGALNFNSSAAQTISGNISDVGALVQSGSGTLTLISSNSYSGNTTLSAGTTVVGNNNALGTGTVNLNGGALLDTSAGPTIANNINVMSGGGTIAVGGSGADFTLTGTLGGAGNLTLGGGATPVKSLNLNLTANTMTGGTITIPVEANNQTVVRFNTTAASSSVLDWVINGAPDRGTMLDVNGTYSFGSLAGSSSALFQGNYQSGNIALIIGGNNNSATFSGRIVNNGPTISVSKVGTGTETFAGANAFTGGVNINGGILAVASTGALSSSGPIAFGGGTLQYSSANQVDYSARITNSTAPISIDLNGTNVTFASALSASNTAGLMLTNSTGTGALTLTAANAYTGTTLINGGTLALSGSGAINTSTNINVASGGTFDVSAISYALGNNQMLSGSGTVTGAVATASGSSALAPGGVGAAGTLTFHSNLNLANGGRPMFDLSTSAAGSNDLVVVNGNLTLSGSDAIHINALSGSANLDQTADYVLFSVTGSTTLVGTPALFFDNTPPGNFTHYSITTSGNNVVLHYSLVAAPVVNTVVVTNTADGSTAGVRGQSATVYVTVTPGSGTITNVSADLSSLGGSASQALNSLGGNAWSYTLVLGAGATVGADTVNVVAKDTTPSSAYGSATFTVNTSSDTWTGLAADDNWTSGTNWSSTLPPFAGDSVVFTGSTRPTPLMDDNYNVAGLTFDGSAGSFTIGAAAGKTLTLTGGITNNSSSSQVINVPIVLIGTQSILDPNGVGNTLAGNISGSGGLTMDTSGFGILTLSGTNTYSGDTTIPSVFGTLYLGSSNAIPSGAGKGNVSVTGTLNLNGNNAAINGLSGPGYVDNTGGSPVALSIGNGDATSTFGSLIQNGGGALTLVKVGAGALTLSGANTYSGGTTLSAGQVSLGASSTGIPVTSGPLGTGALTLNGGTLQMNAQTLGNDLIVSAGTTNIIDNFGGNSTISGNLSGAGTVTLQNSGNVNMSVYGGGASQDWSGFTGTFKYITGSRVINFNPGGTVCDLSHAAFYMSGTLNNSTLGIGSGQTLKLGSLSGPSGYMYVNNGAALEIGNLDTDTTFGGTIQGSGVVTKVGTGTLTLSGANTYTNLTTVSNGTLVVSTTTSANGDYMVVDGATLGVTVAGGGSLKVSSLTFGNSTNAFIGLSSTVNPAITNTGALTLAGTVTVNVSGAVSVGQYPLIAYASIGGTGGFVVGSLPYGSAANIVTNGNTIILNVTTGSPPTFEWTGVNNGNWDLTVANNWLSNGVSSVYSDGKDVKFDDSSTRTNVVAATNVAPSSVLVTNSTRNYTLAGSGGITGSASLTKSGNGKLTLANTNSYSGGTVINNGTLQLGDGVANNGVVAGNITDNGSLIFANPLDQTFSAVISGTGSVVERSPGNLTLGLNNTYAGGTLLDSSTVTLLNGAVQAFGTGTLTFSNATLYVKPGGGSSYNSANSDYIGNSVAVPAGTTNVIDNSQNSYGNLWVGGDGVQWTGSGTVTIQNRSSVVGAAVLWNGNTLANFHGTLNIGATGSGTMYVGIGYNSANGGTGASVATFDASGVACSLDNSGSTLCQVVDANCTTVKFGSLSASIPGTVLRGNSSSSPANQLTFEVGALNTSSTFAGAINDWGSSGTALRKVGTGTLELSGANTYTGPTTINGGVLMIDTAYLVGSSDIVIASPGVLNLNFGGANTVNTLTLDGVQQAAGTYGANGSGAAHIDDVHFAGTGVLNVTTGPSAPTPEPISATFSGGVLQLSWSNSTWSLQMQTNSLATGLSTNWTTLIPANSGINSTNITVDPTKPTVFYRLTYP